jgi:hypothetical protein
VCTAMQGIHAVPAEFVESQVESVLIDIGCDVVSLPTCIFLLTAGLGACFGSLAIPADSVCRCL